MGQNSREFLEQREREYSESLLIEVEENYYKEHFDIFSKTKILKKIVKDKERFEDDLIHKKLTSEYMKASKKLRDYEYNKRHK